MYKIIQLLQILMTFAFKDLPRDGSKGELAYFFYRVSIMSKNVVFVGGPNLCTK